MDGKKKDPMANPVTKQKPYGTIYPGYFIQMQDTPVGRRSIAFVDAARQRRERLWRYGCLFCQTGVKAAVAWIQLLSNRIERTVPRLIWLGIDRRRERIRGISV